MHYSILRNTVPFKVVRNCENFSLRLLNSFCVFRDSAEIMLTYSVTTPKDTVHRDWRIRSEDKKINVYVEYAKNNLPYLENMSIVINLSLPRRILNQNS